MREACLEKMNKDQVEVEFSECTNMEQKVGWSSACVDASTQMCPLNTRRDVGIKTQVGHHRLLQNCVYTAKIQKETNTKSSFVVRVVLFSAALLPTKKF